jgi:hypothetical protein
MSLAHLFTSRSPLGHHSTSHQGDLQPSEEINLAAHLAGHQGELSGDLFGEAAPATAEVRRAPIGPGLLGRSVVVRARTMGTLGAG